MKNRWILLLAIVMGFFLAIPVLKQNVLKKDEKETTPLSLYVLQTGVFTQLENAKAMQETLKNAVIYEDQAVYRVFVGAALDEEGLKKVEKSLQLQNISYYKKEIIFESDGELKQYNMLLDKTEDETTILLLNQKILEKVSSL